jgi:hypothetical protein
MPTPPTNLPANIAGYIAKAWRPITAGTSQGQGPTSLHNVALPYQIGWENLLQTGVLAGATFLSTVHELAPLFEQPSVTVARSEELYPFHGGSALFTSPVHPPAKATWSLATIARAEEPQPAPGGVFATGTHPLGPPPPLVLPAIVVSQVPADLQIGLAGGASYSAPPHLAPLPSWFPPVYARAEEARPPEGSAVWTGPHQTAPLFQSVPAVYFRGDDPRPEQGAVYLAHGGVTSVVANVQTARPVIVTSEPPQPDRGGAYATGAHQLAPLPAWPAAVYARAEEPQPYPGSANWTGPRQLAAIFQSVPPAYARGDDPRPEAGSVYLAHGTATAAAPQNQTARPVLVSSEPPQPYAGSVFATGTHQLKPLPGAPAPYYARAEEPRPDWIGAGGTFHSLEQLQAAVASIEYHVYANTGVADPINYNTPISTTAGLTYTTSALAYPGIWRFGVRAFNANGEEKNLDAAVTIILDASGVDITNRPKAPTALRALALAGGTIRVEWAYNTINPVPLPTGFHVYIGTGGTPSYGSPIATVSFQASIAGSFVANIPALSNGTVYTIGVRAYNSTAQEPNTVTVNCTADSTGPSAVVSLTAAAI